MAECCCCTDKPITLIYTCSGTDHGVEKGKTTITKELIQRVKEILISGLSCD